MFTSQTQVRWVVGGAGAIVGSPLRAARDILRLWANRIRQRRELADLEDYQLNDIGKTRQQALAEAGKPFWRA